MKRVFGILFLSLFLLNPSFSQSLGFIPPSPSQEKAIIKTHGAFFGDEMNTYDSGPLPGTGLLNPKASRLDLRDYGWLTPIRDQHQCGSCWAFATLAAYESSYAFRNNGLQIDLSEQNALDCSKVGNCGGGFPGSLMKWWVEDNNEVALENQDPYIGYQTYCRGVQGRFKAIAWNFIAPSLSWSDIPGIDQIKQAICRHGAIVTGVYATLNFQNFYGAGVYNEPTHGTINHVLDIIGWDDSQQAWLVKNSWGTRWGNQGFAWIAYGSNQIGTSSLWIDAELNNQVQPKPVIQDNTAYITDNLSPDQSYEEVWLSLNGKTEVFSIDRRTAITQQKAISFSGNQKVDYSIRSKTIFVDSKGITRMGFGTGTGKLEPGTHMEYRIFIRRFLNEAKTSYEIYLKPI